MGPWYHLTQRRTKDNKPKVYGDVCSPLQDLTKLANFQVDSVTITIYEGEVKNSVPFDNFITACLPWPMCTLYTQSRDIYMEATPKVDAQFWENLPNWQISDHDMTTSQLLPLLS